MAKTTWPQNLESDDAGVTDDLRASDKAAGFEITDEFERFNQRNDAFCRGWWDESFRSKDIEAFYTSSRMEATPRKGEGFNQKDFALRNAAWSVADDYAERNTETRGLREGFLDPLEPSRPAAAEQVEVEDVAAMTAEIHRLAKLFGADIVGVAAYDPRWNYSFMADARTMEEKPVPMPKGITSVIVLGHGMDYDLVQTYPSALAGAAVGLGYSKEAPTAVQLSQYIRNIGYEAVASMNDTSLVIPYAIKAGLGEYGRNQMVITPEFGPRVRFSKIFTTLPLNHNEPSLFGVRQTCDICTRCADACPPKALPHGPPEEGGENRCNIRGVVKWSANCEKCFGYWAKLRSDCAICMRVCPYNQDYTKAAARIIRRLLAGRFRRLGLWLFDKSKGADRLRPAHWWES